MGNISDINEPWREHDGIDVENFLKRQLSSLFDIKFGAVARIGTDLVFYDKENGSILETISLSGQVYTINIQSDMPQAFYVLADETTKVIQISPETSVSSFGQSESEDYPESYTYIVAVNTGEGYINRISGNIPIHGTISFDIRPYLSTGDNYVRVSVTGQQSHQTRTMVFTSTLTTLTLNVNHAWQIAWREGESYNITGIRFAGSLVKTLHVAVNGVECDAVTYSANQSYTTTSTSFTIPATAFPAESNSTCLVQVWMTAQGVSTPIFSYNIMCVVEEDTTPIVAINAIKPTVFNYSSGDLFSYAVYNANKISIDLSAMLDSTLYSIADNIIITGRESETQYAFAFSIEVDTGVNETKLGSFFISAEAYMNDTAGLLSMSSTVFDNSYSYLATPGALFYINAATRNNGTDNKELIINEMGASQDGNFASSYNAIWSGLSWYNDGWFSDSENHRALVIPAGSSCSITGLSPLSYLSSYQNGTSIELLIKNSNPSNYDSPILTIASTVGNSPCGIFIYPTKISIFGQSERDEDFQSVNISENRITHIVITFVKSYEGENGKNLCSVYINGISNVNFSFEGSSSFGTGNIVIGQSDTDVYLYKMRIYGIALEAQAVFANFLNCIFDGLEFTRTELTASNNILDGDSVDYTLVKAAGYNTMVITTPNNVPIPSFFNQQTIDGCSVRFEYADDSQKNVTVNNVPMDGQGTTSKKYYRWNLRWKTSGNTEWVYGDGTTETGKEGHFIKDSTHQRVDRITAKKNIASSPQGHKMGLTGLYNDLFHAINSVVSGLPNSSYNVAVYQFPFVGFQYNSQNGQYNFIGIYTAGPDKGSKVTFGYLKNTYPNCLSIEGPNHAPRGTRFLCPWVDVEYDPNEETLTYGGEEGWDCDYVKYETSTKGTQEDWDAIRSLYETEWRPAYDCVYDNSPYIASSNEVITSLNAQGINTLSSLLDASNAAIVKEGFTNGMRVRNEFIAFYASDADNTLGIAKYDLFFYRLSTKQYEKLPSNYTNNNALTGLTSYLSTLGYSTTNPTTAQIIEARAARFKATMENYWDLPQTLFHYCFCILYGVTDNFAKNSYPQKYLHLSENGAGNRWGWRQDDLDSVLMTDNNGSNTKKYSVEHLDTFDNVQIFQGGDSALWVLIHDNYETETKEMMNRIAQAATSLATSMSIQGNGMHESLFNLTSYYCWEHSSKYFPATLYEKDRRWSYLEPWLLAGKTIPASSELYPAQYNGVAPLRQALGDQYQGERLWMERRIAYIFSKYRIGAFTGTNTGYNAIVFTLASPFTFTLTPAIDLYPVVSLVSYDEQASRTQAGTSAQVYIGASGDSNNSIHGGDWLASLGDLHLMRLGSRGGTSSIDFYVTAARLQNLKIGDATPWDTSTVGFNATAFGVTSPTITYLDARNTSTIRNNINLLDCPRLRTCLFAGSGASGLMLPVGAKLTQVSFPSNASTVFMHSLPFLQNSGLTLPNLAGITTLYINNCDSLNPLSIVDSIINTTGEQLAYATIIWDGVVTGDAKTLTSLLRRTGRVEFDGQALITVGGIPDIEGTVNISGEEVVYTDIEALDLDFANEEDYSGTLKKARARAFGSSLYVIYDPAEIIEPLLYFEAVTAGSTVGMTNYNDNAPVLYQSTDKENWTLWDYSDITLQNVGDRVYFYGENNTINQSSGPTVIKYSIFTGTGLTRVGGSLNTLLDRDGSSNASTPGCFGNLFKDNESIDLATDFTMKVPNIGQATCSMTFAGCTSIVNVPNIFNRTNEFNRQACTRMFSGCTSLRKAPHIVIEGEIPNEGFYEMFSGCTNLVNISEIEIRDLTLLSGRVSIFFSMFKDCSSIVDASHFVLTNNGGSKTDTDVYNAMFSGCSSLVNTPSFTVSGELGKDCCRSMFEGCVSIVDISRIYFGNYTATMGGNFVRMFYGCSSIVDASHISLGTGAFGNMFQNCTSLEYIPRISRTVNGDSDTFNSMFKGCSSLRAISSSTINIGGNLDLRICQSMFSDCTNLVDASNVSIYGTSSSYVSLINMFTGCTSLVNMPSIDLVVSPGSNPPNDVFIGCSSITDISSINFYNDDSRETKIFGSNVFKDCTSLVTADLTGVTRLRNSVFEGCSNLASVTLEDGATVGDGCFKNDTKLQTITLLGSVTTGVYAFEGCTSVNRINIASIEDWLNCSWRAGSGHPFSASNGGSVYLNDQLVTSVTIPSTMTEISRETFLKTKNLQSVTVHNALTSIGDGAFNGCSDLVSFNQAPSIVSVGANAFQNTKLTSFTFADGATIANNAFKSCRNLQSLTLLGSITVAGPFDECSSMARINISSMESFLRCDWGSVYGHPFNSSTNVEHSLYLNGQLVTDVTIPSTITTLPAKAFHKLQTIQSVTFHNAVTEIGKDAFSLCTGLAAPDLPSSITYIGENAFTYCRFTEITIRATTPPTAGTDIFKSTPNSLTIYVPAASVDAYKVASGWSTYASKISAITE